MSSNTHTHTHTQMREEKKKEANFINNLLEFFFSFYLVLKQNTFMTFSNQNPKHPKTQSESQTSKNPQYLTSTLKL